MKLPLKNGAGADQTIVTNGVASVSDKSGAITEADEPQLVMAANADRGGWFFQNRGTQSMLISETGDENGIDDTGILVAAGAVFPPPNYPVTVEAIYVKSAEESAKWSAREWDD